MKKEGKFEPKDSSRHQSEDKQAVIQKIGPTQVLKSPKTENPARKRKFSEQPPTNHNAKT